MKYVLPLTLSISLLTYLPNAQAGDQTNFYVGVQYSYQKIASLSDVDLDAAGLIVGYQFTPYFSLETRLNVGTSEHSSLCVCAEQERWSEVYKQEISQQASLLVKGTYPISEDLSVYALAGITNSAFNIQTISNETVVEGDSTMTSIRFNDAEDQSESGLTYGVGINYQLSTELSVFLDYQVLPDLAVSNLHNSSWRSANFGVNYSF